MLDVTKIRDDFPILSRTVHGKPLVYLDNAATSQKPRSVIRALTGYYEEYNSNVHRGVHTLSMEATDKYEEARQKVAHFVNAESPESIVWTRNTTESINLVANTWAREHILPGDEIVVTEMEHHSNLVPWQQVAREKGATLRFLPLGDDGNLDLTDVDTIINPRTKLVAIVHASNSLGTINPVRELAAMARRVGAAVLVDGAQSVPHMPVDVRDLDCDFLAFSGHKMLGPTGIGALYAKPEVLEKMEPFLTGGEMVLQVSYEEASWNDLPMRFEAGTPNIADAIALGAAVDYLNDLGMDNVRKHEMGLTEYALNAFRELGRGPGRIRAQGHHQARRDHLVPLVRGASPRHRDLPRQRGHRRTHRPPLHHAADGAPRRARHGQSELLHLQHGSGSRCVGRRAETGPEVLRPWPPANSMTCTATRSSTTAATPAIPT